MSSSALRKKLDSIPELYEQLVHFEREPEQVSQSFVHCVVRYAVFLITLSIEYPYWSKNSI